MSRNEPAFPASGPQPGRWALIALAAVSLSLLAAGCSRAADDYDAFSDPQATVLQPGDGAQWLRGGLHTHSLASDGDAFPEEVIARYAREGYAFLALSEHNLVSDGSRWIAVDAPMREQALARAQQLGLALERRQTGGTVEVRLAGYPELRERAQREHGLLLLPSQEVSALHQGASLHLNALGVAQTLPVLAGSSVADTVIRNAQAIHASGGLAQLNHPNFYGSVLAEQLPLMQGLDLLEIHNAHPLSADLGGGPQLPTETLWDITLTRHASLGEPLGPWGVATDDAHNFGDGPARPARGWVNVLAGAAQPQAIMDALRQGRFHASTGVAIQRLAQSPQGLGVGIVAEPGVHYRVEFIGSRRQDWAAPGARRQLGSGELYASHAYPEGVGKVLQISEGAKASYRFHPDDLYVRVRISADRAPADPSQPLQRAQAWSQPVPGPAYGQGPALPMASPSDAALHLGVQASFLPLPADVRWRDGAHCAIDQVAGRDPASEAPVSRAAALRLTGWVADPAARERIDGVALVLDGQGQRFVAEGAPWVARPDVATVIGNPLAEAGGFNIDTSARQVPPGRYRVLVLARRGDELTGCDSGRALVIAP